MSTSFWHLIDTAQLTDDHEDQVGTQLAYERQLKDWIDMYF